MIDPKDVEAAFLDAMAKAGIDLLPETLIADGQRHRFRSYDTDSAYSKGAKESGSGWYILHIDHAPAGKFGCFRSLPEGQGWSYGKTENLTEAQRAKIKEDQRIAKEEQARNLERNYREKAERNANRWRRAAPVKGRQDQYLRDKGVDSHGLRSDKGGLLIPLSDTDGKLWALQTIKPGAPKPKKVVGKQKAMSYGFGGDPAEAGVEWIGEGYATLATVLAATGEPVRMGVCASNLPEVARARHATLPDVHYKFAADNDRYTPPKSSYPEGNPGVSYALAAAAAIRAAGGTASVHWPELPDTASPKDSDFNDLARLTSLEEVRRQLAIDREGQPIPGPPAPKAEPEQPPEEPPEPANEAHLEHDLKALIGYTGKAPLPLDPETGLPWPKIRGDYELGCGVWALKHKSAGRGPDNKTIWETHAELITYQPIWVEAVTESQMDGYGAVLRYIDIRGRYRRTVINAGLLHMTGGKLAQEMARLGMVVEPGKDKDTQRYISAQMSVSPRFIESRSRLGWYQVGEGGDKDWAFILPDQIIGDSKGEIVYQSEEIPPSMAASLSACGSLVDWQRSVAAMCTGNPLLQFGVLVALACPLLLLTEQGCGGFHFFGSSSKGKTTLAQAAASVWGNGIDPSQDGARSSIRSWDTTDNNLEGLGELHSHQLLAMDEIGRSTMHDLGRAVYKLASGSGKGRATQSGGLRPIRNWVTLFISNGEISLRQVMGRKGADFFTGQRVRLVDIPASNTVVATGKEDDPKRYVDRLKSNCGKYYGTAGRAMVAYLMAHIKEKGWSAYSRQLQRMLATAEEEIVWDACSKADTRPEELPGEVRRALKRFALVCLAGVLAGVGEDEAAGIVPWNMPEVYAVCGEVAGRWLRELGRERSDLERALSHLRQALLTNGFRIQPAEENEDKKVTDVRDRIGWRYYSGGDWYYLLIPSGFEELCGHFDPKPILEHLETAGHLRGEGGTHRFRAKAPRVLPGLSGSRPRLIWIKEDFINEDDPGEIEPREPEQPPQAGELDF